MASPHPQDRNGKKKMLKNNTFPIIPGSQAHLMPIASGTKWLLAWCWLIAAFSSGRREFYGLLAGGLCSHRQKESFGHLRYWPEIRQGSRPHDWLSTCLFSPLRISTPSSPHPQINFKNRTKKLHSAALCHRQDERAWFKSSVWEVPVLLGSSILGCLYFNRGRSFDQRREYEVPYHHPTRTHRPYHTPPSCSHKHAFPGEMLSTPAQDNS